jgi:bacterioferritin
MEQEMKIPMQKRIPEAPPKPKDLFTVHPDFIVGINKALSLEYSAFIQYYQHAAVVQGSLAWFSKDMLEHAEQEAEHAQKLNDHLNYLGIVPTVSVGQVKTSPLAIEMLKQDLDAENIAIALYTELIAQARALGMPGTEIILMEIIEDEQHHANDLQAILEVKK